MHEHKPDSVDFGILQNLTRDSRLPYSRMASQMGLTLNTVKARVKNMISNGTIQAFATRTNPSFLGYGVRWMIKSDSSQAARRIASWTKGIGHMFMRVECVGGTTFVGVALREEDIPKAVQSSEKLRPSITNDYFLKISPTRHRFVWSDYLILRTLLHNPRMRISEVADATSLAERTVTRRLESMVKTVW